MWDTAFSPDGKSILAVGQDGFVRRWNAQTGHEEARVSGGGSSLKTVAFSRDGGRFAAGGVDGDVLVWETAGGPPVATLRGQGPWVYDVSFGPTNDAVTSGYDDGTVRLWDAGRTQAWTVPETDGSVDFDRSGRRVLTRTRLASSASGTPKTAGSSSVFLGRVTT